MTNNISPERLAAIEELNTKPGRALISLVRSQTIDLFAGSLSPELANNLEGLRRRAPDGVKVPVDAITRTDDGYTIVLDKTTNETLFVSDQAAAPFTQTLGGGLCNLSKDLEIILDVVSSQDDGKSRPCIDYLTWQDAAQHFPGTAVEGTSRTSLIFQSDDFEKLIVTERGPTFDANAIDLWQAEEDFYGQDDDFIFVGQEPLGTGKFKYLMERRLKNKRLKIFWLVGGNQLKNLYTDYRHFLSIVDVVSLNLAEAAQFFGFEPLRRKHKNANELRIMYAREISRRVLDFGANHVVITDGAKGASLARKARGGQVEFVYSPLIQENAIVVDPGVTEDTGCGDSFAASIAAYVLTSGPTLKLNEAANFAHYIAGIIYQRPRPNLTEKDKGFVELALSKARAGGAFIGKHETMDRNTCQIHPAIITPKGPRRNVLVLILGGDPADPEYPRITGAGAAIENLATMCKDGRYSLAPLIRIIPRLSTDTRAAGRLGMQTIPETEMSRLIETNEMCREIGNLDPGEARHGVQKADITGHDGLYLLRTTLLEALEILSSEDFAEKFGDIKFWHFVTEKVDERLLWYSKIQGVSSQQSQESTRLEMRDYIVHAQAPQFRFFSAQANNLAEFEREMTNQLMIRVDDLLAGIFRK